MKRRAFSLIMALAMLLCVIAVQATAAELTTEILVEPQYEDALDFGDGYAAVKKDGKWGYIDEEGNVVVDFQYDWAGYCYEGLAVTATIVTEMEQEYYVFHLIDMEGMDVVLADSQNIWSPFAEETYGFSPNYAYNWEGIAEDMISWYSDYACYNGTVVVSGVPYTPDGKEIVLKEEEQAKLFVPTWEDGYEEPFTYFYATGAAVDGVIPMKAAYIGQMNGYEQAFLMDVEGNIVQTFEAVNYDEGTGIDLVMAPNDGLVLASILYEEDPEYPGSWYTRFGIMDEASQWVIQPEYTYYRYFLSGWFYSEGLLTAGTDDGLWGALDTQGNVAVPFEYLYLDMVVNGYSAAQKQDGTYVYLDTEGNEYQIGGINGGVAEVAICSAFGSEGIAAVLDTDGNAYCISSQPIEGVLPAVQNSEKLDSSVYFPEYEEGERPGVIYTPSEIVVIEDNGLYGYMKLDVNLVINPFEDVVEGAFYYKPVMWAVENDVTQGISETQFAPKSDCTRGQVVTFLWRAAGCPEPTTDEHPFTDIKESAFYYKAMLWAVEKGITNGLTATTFGPGTPCNRGQVVTFLYRAANLPEVAISEHPFTDVKETAFYYKAMLWAVENGITSGMTATTFVPSGICTRGQIVTFLYRYISDNGVEVPEKPAEPEKPDDNTTEYAYVLIAQESTTINGDETLHSVITGEFDPETLTVTAQRVENGENVCTIVQSYDDSYNLIKQDMGTGLVMEYEYDEKGNVICQKSVSSDGTQQTTTYTYNEQGLNDYQKIVATNNGEVFADQEVYVSYDDKGNPLKFEIYMDGQLGQYTVYEYDAQGNPTCNKIYDGDDNLISKIEVSKDPETGAEIITMYNADGTVGYVQTVRYNENGNLVYMKYVSEGQQYSMETEIEYLKVPLN